ncbi:NADH-quinone oxidoreductase subunit C [Escherichia coli]
MTPTNRSIRRDAARSGGCVAQREVRDMYGLIPVGLPDERRLVLPDDWPDELYPLRKDSMDYQRPCPLPC